MEDCRRQFHERQEQYDADHTKQAEQLKEDIRCEREVREKLRQPSSVGSSVTLFPPEAQSVESSSAEGSGGSPVQESPDVGGEKTAQSEGETQQQTDSVESESRQTDES